MGETKMTTDDFFKIIFIAIILLVVGVLTLQIYEQSKLNEIECGKEGGVYVSISSKCMLSNYTCYKNTRNIWTCSIKTNHISLTDAITTLREKDYHRATMVKEMSR